MANMLVSSISNFQVPTIRLFTAKISSAVLLLLAILLLLLLMIFLMIFCVCRVFRILPRLQILDGIPLLDSDLQDGVANAKSCVIS